MVAGSLINYSKVGSIPTLPTKRRLMKDSSKTVCSFVIFVVLLVMFIYCSWKFERWWNYELGYRDQVEKDLAPIKAEMAEMKERISQLEKEREK